MSTSLRFSLMGKYEIYIIQFQLEI